MSGLGRPQLEGRDGQNAAAGADVQHPLAAFHQFVQRGKAQGGGLVGAGAEGHAGVQPDDGAVGGVVLPAGHDGQPPADGQGVVIGLPGGLPVLLLHAVRREGIVQFGPFQPPAQQIQHFGGVLVGGEVEVHRHMGAVLVQKVLLDEVHMGNALHLLFQVGIVLDVNAAAGHPGGDGLGGVRLGFGNGDLDVGPLHKGALLWVFSEPAPPGKARRDPAGPGGTGAAGVLLRI